MIHLRFTWLHGGGVRLQKKLQASRDIYKDRLFLCACYVIVPILRTRYRISKAKAEQARLFFGGGG